MFAVSEGQEARVLLDNGDSNLVRYAINIPNIISIDNWEIIIND